MNHRGANGTISYKSRNAIKEVEQLEEILFSEFKIPHQEEQIDRAKARIREQVMQEKQAFDGDERMARVYRLYGKMEKNGPIRPMIPQMEELNEDLGKMNAGLNQIGYEMDRSHQEVER